MLLYLMLMLARSDVIDPNFIYCTILPDGVMPRGYAPQMVYNLFG